MGKLIRIAWDRFQIIGQANGDYVARVITLLFYFTLLVPFALITRLFIDPLKIRHANVDWRARKPVGSSIEEARSQS